MGPGGPRGYRAARGKDFAALLRLETEEATLATEINHDEKQLEDPRWSASVHIRTLLDRKRERFEKVKAELAEARRVVHRPMYAGRADEDRSEPPVIVEGEVVKDSHWMEKNDWRRRDESAGKEQGE